MAGLCACRDLGLAARGGGGGGQIDVYQVLGASHLRSILVGSVGGGRWVSAMRHAHALHSNGCSTAHAEIVPPEQLVRVGAVAAAALNRAAHKCGEGGDGGLAEQPRLAAALGTIKWSIPAGCMKFHSATFKG